MKFYAPNRGDKRIRKFFAWTPYTIGNETRWLEKVRILQEYDKWVYGAGWIDKKFLGEGEK